MFLFLNVQDRKKQEHAYKSVINGLKTKSENLKVKIKPYLLDNF